MNVRFWTIREAAALSNVSEATIRRAVYSGVLKAEKHPGGVTRIVDSSLRAWCRNRKLSYFE